MEIYIRLSLSVKEIRSEFYPQPFLMMSKNNGEEHTVKLGVTRRDYTGGKRVYLLVLNEWLSITSVNISDMNILCGMIAIVLVSFANQNLFAKHHQANISYHGVCLTSGLTN